MSLQYPVLSFTVAPSYLLPKYQPENRCKIRVQCSDCGKDILLLAGAGKFKDRYVCQACSGATISASWN
jgi:hypothetical protein